MSTVAVISVNGFLGKPVIEGLLSEPFISKISTPIKLITSNPDKKPIESDKVEYINSKEVPYTESLKGVDVVISLGGVPTLFTNEVIDAAAQNGVKLYIPSQFGCDNEAASVDFPGFNGVKTEHSKAARAAGLKTVDLYNTYFFDGETFIGFDIPFYFIKDNSIEIIGDESTQIQLSFFKDIGKVVASLATSDDYSKIPDHLRFNSDSTTIGALIEKYEKKNGTKLNKTYVDAKKFYEDLKATHAKDGMNYDNFLSYLNAITVGGDGKGAIFTSANEKEFINPGESLFKWSKFA